MKPIRSAIICVVATLLTVTTSGCSEAKEPLVDAGTEKWSSIPRSGAFDYQLGTPYKFNSDSTNELVVARDSSSAPLPQSYSICYVNGFQTQPEEIDGDSPLSEALLRDDDGNPVVDPDWPGEYILDPTSEKNRETIFKSRSHLIHACADKGFDAVEVDNLDSWTRFDALSEESSWALAEEYVADAHGRGMAIAQKNSAESATAAKSELGFDFAVSEECGAFGECDSYRKAYGDFVFNVEYPDTLESEGMSFADVCGEDSTPSRTILRDRDLGAPGDAGYIYRAC